MEVDKYIPTYEKIKAYIREKIEDGTYKPNERVPSVNELPGMFNTSRNTAVRAIIDLVHEGLLYRIQGKGTFVNSPTKWKNKKRLEKIGIVGPPWFSGLDIPAISQMNMFNIFKGIVDGFNYIPYGMDLFPNNIFRFLERDVLDFIAIKNLKAIISVGYFGKDEKVSNEFKKKGIPLIIISCWKKGIPCHFVTDDEEKGAYKAIEYLSRLGHKSIGCMTGPLTAPSYGPRFRGFLRAVKDLNLDNRKELIVEGIEGQEIFDGTVRLLKLSKRPTAIFATTDTRAFIILQSLREHNIQVPQEVSVVGFDDIEVSAHQTPPLTTVKSPSYEMGQEAVKLANECLEGKHKDFVTRVLKTELIVRESCNFKK